jgi:glutamate 5-kinase
MHDEDKLEAERERRLRAARRLVVKVGTNTVTGLDGSLCAERMEPIVRSISTLMKAGRKVILVSSGAVGLGRAWLGLHDSRLRDLETKQACAAVGQSLLMDAYKRMFSAWDGKVAQVLLTEEDFTNWTRYSNLRHTVEKLLGFGVLPIVNENDTVSTAELEVVHPRPRISAFSDNDRLAALVMSGLEADALVLLTTVDGFLRQASSSPAGEGAARREVIPIIDEITPELRSLAAGPSARGRGGMFTKLEAAEIAMHCGGTALIANGATPDILDRAFAGERVGTAFMPLKRMRGKRRWIAFAANVQGRIVVDAGAQKVITEGKASLLPSGILRIESHFVPKDVVSIVNGEGVEFARGIASCASHEAEEWLAKRNAAGKSSVAPASREVVTRDNIVLVHS